MWAARPTSGLKDAGLKIARTGLRTMPCAAPSQRAPHELSESALSSAESALSSAESALSSAESALPSAESALPSADSALSSADSALSSAVAIERAPHDVSGLALSFSGGGLVAAAYHLGVYEALTRRGADLIDTTAAPLVGASAGALVAAAIAAGVHLDDAVASLDRIINNMRRRGGGPFSTDLLRLVRPELEAILPGDAHERCCARGTVIFLTDVSRRPWLPVLIDQWDSRKRLIDSILLSSYIPGLTSRRSPVLDGGPLIDGGLRSNFPLHPTLPRTVRVSPFSGELDICPRVDSQTKPRSLLMPSKVRLHVTRANASAILRTLFPPKDDAWLQKLLGKGFDDGCRWLKTQ